MKRKAWLFATLFWLPKSFAHAEAGKAFSHISQGEILWSLFLFGFAIPAVLGLFIYWLLKLVNKGSQISLTWVIVLSVLVWWCGWLLALNIHGH